MNTEQLSCDFEAWWDEYQRPWLPNGVAGYEHAKKAWANAAASMRSRCVEKVKRLIDSLQDEHGSAQVAIRRMALHDIIAALESVSIQEQEK